MPWMREQGMQINPGVKTIEDDLERAIHAAGGISDDNAHNFGKVSCPSCAPLPRAAWIFPKYSYQSAVISTACSDQALLPSVTSYHILCI